MTLSKTFYIEMLQEEHENKIQ